MRSASKRAVACFLAAVFSLTQAVPLSFAQGYLRGQAVSESILAQLRSEAGWQFGAAGRNLENLGPANLEHLGRAIHETARLEATAIDLGRPMDSQLADYAAAFKRLRGQDAGEAVLQSRSRQAALSQETLQAIIQAEGLTGRIRPVLIADDEGESLLARDGVINTPAHTGLILHAHKSTEPKPVFFSLEQVSAFSAEGQLGRAILTALVRHRAEDVLRGSHEDLPAEEAAALQAEVDRIAGEIEAENAARSALNRANRRAVAVTRAEEIQSQPREVIHHLDLDQLSRSRFQGREVPAALLDDLRERLQALVPRQLDAVSLTQQRGVVTITAKTHGPATPLTDRILADAVEAAVAAVATQRGMAQRLHLEDSFQQSVDELIGRHSPPHREWFEKFLTYRVDRSRWYRFTVNQVRALLNQKLADAKISRTPAVSLGVLLPSEDSRTLIFDAFPGAKNMALFPSEPGAGELAVRVTLSLSRKGEVQSVLFHPTLREDAKGSGGEEDTNERAHRNWINASLLMRAALLLATIGVPNGAFVVFVDDFIDWRQLNQRRPVSLGELADRPLPDTSDWERPSLEEMASRVVMPQEQGRNLKAFLDAWWKRRDPSTQRKLRDMDAVQVTRAGQAVFGPTLRRSQSAAEEAFILQAGDVVHALRQAGAAQQTSGTLGAIHTSTPRFSFSQLQRISDTLANLRNLVVKVDVAFQDASPQVDDGVMTITAASYGLVADDFVLESVVAPDFNALQEARGAVPGIAGGKVEVKDGKAVYRLESLTAEDITALRDATTQRGAAQMVGRLNEVFLEEMFRVVAALREFRWDPVATRRVIPAVSELPNGNVVVTLDPADSLPSEWSAEKLVAHAGHLKIAVQQVQSGGLKPAYAFELTKQEYEAVASKIGPDDYRDRLTALAEMLGYSLEELDWMGRAIRRHQASLKAGLRVYYDRTLPTGSERPPVLYEVSTGKVIPTGWRDGAYFFSFAQNEKTPTAQDLANEGRFEDITRLVLGQLGAAWIQPELLQLPSVKSGELALEIVDGDILQITAAWPKVPVNRMNDAMLRDSIAVIRHAESNPHIAGTILTGAGRLAFIAGGDLREVRKMTTEDQTEALIRLWQKATNAIDRSSKPVVAALNGVTAGGGSHLAVAAHARVMARTRRDHLDQREEANFIQHPELKHGFIPLAGGLWRVALLFGPDAAVHMFLDLDAKGYPPRIEADEALRIGYADVVVDEPSALQAAAIEQVRFLNMQGRDSWQRDWPALAEQHQDRLLGLMDDAAFQARLEANPLAEQFWDIIETAFLEGGEQADALTVQFGRKAFLSERAKRGIDAVFASRRNQEIEAGADAAKDKQKGMAQDSIGGAADLWWPMERWELRGEISRVLGELKWLDWVSPSDPGDLSRIVVMAESYLLDGITEERLTAFAKVRLLPRPELPKRSSYFHELFDGLEEVDKLFITALMRAHADLEASQHKEVANLLAAYFLVQPPRTDGHREILIKRLVDFGIDKGAARTLAQSIQISRPPKESRQIREAKQHQAQYDQLVPALILQLNRLKQQSQPLIEAVKTAWAAARQQGAVSSMDALTPKGEHIVNGIVGHSGLGKPAARNVRHALTETVVSGALAWPERQRAMALLELRRSLRRAGVNPGVARSIVKRADSQAGRLPLESLVNGHSPAVPQAIVEAFIDGVQVVHDSGMFPQIGVKENKAGGNILLFSASQDTEKALRKLAEAVAEADFKDIWVTTVEDKAGRLESVSVNADYPSFLQLAAVLEREMRSELKQRGTVDPRYRSLLGIFNYLWEYDDSHPTAEGIAVTTGHTANTVRDHLAKLDELELLNIEGESVVNGYCNLRFAIWRLDSVSRMELRAALRTIGTDPLSFHKGSVEHILQILHRVPYRSKTSQALSIDVVFDFLNQFAVLTRSLLSRDPSAVRFVQDHAGGGEIVIRSDTSVYPRARLRRLRDAFEEATELNVQVSQAAGGRRLYSFFVPTDAQFDVLKRLAQQQGSVSTKDARVFIFSSRPSQGLLNQAGSTQVLSKPLDVLEGETPGKFILRHRKAADLTQEQLSEQAHVVVSTIRRWENDETLPSKLASISLGEALSFDGVAFFKELVNPIRFERRLPQLKQPEAADKTVGGLIRKHRLDNGWTHEDLAAEANINVTTISRHENNHVSLNNRSIRAYAKAFGISPKAFQQQGAVGNQVQMEAEVLWADLIAVATELRAQGVLKGIRVSGPPRGQPYASFRADERSAGRSWIEKLETALNHFPNVSKDDWEAFSKDERIRSFGEMFIYRYSFNPHKRWLEVTVEGRNDKQLGTVSPESTAMSSAQARALQLTEEQWRTATAMLDTPSDSEIFLWSLLPTSKFMRRLFVEVDRQLSFRPKQRFAAVPVAIVANSDAAAPPVAFQFYNGERPSRATLLSHQPDLRERAVFVTVEVQTEGKAKVVGLVLDAPQKVLAVAKQLVKSENPEELEAASALIALDRIIRAAQHLPSGISAQTPVSLPLTLRQWEILRRSPPQTLSDLLKQPLPSTAQGGVVRAGPTPVTPDERVITKFDAEQTVAQMLARDYSIYGAAHPSLGFQVDPGFEVELTSTRNPSTRQVRENDLTVWTVSSGNTLAVVPSRIEDPNRRIMEAQAVSGAEDTAVSLRFANGRRAYFGEDAGAFSVFDLVDRILISSNGGGLAVLGKSNAQPTQPIAWVQLTGEDEPVPIEGVVYARLSATGRAFAGIRRNPAGDWDVVVKSTGSPVRAIAGTAVASAQWPDHERLPMQVSFVRLSHLLTVEFARSLRQQLYERRLSVRVAPGKTQRGAAQIGLRRYPVLALFEGVKGLEGLEPLQRHLKAVGYGLTPKELEVLFLMVQGMSNREIAFRQGVAVQTAKNHVHNIYTKLGAVDLEQMAYSLPDALVEQFNAWIGQLVQAEAEIYMKAAPHGQDQFRSNPDTLTAAALKVAGIPEQAVNLPAEALRPAAEAIMAHLSRYDSGVLHAVAEVWVTTTQEERQRYRAQPDLAELQVFALSYLLDRRSVAVSQAKREALWVAAHGLARGFLHQSSSLAEAAMKAKESIKAQQVGTASGRLVVTPMTSEELRAFETQLITPSFQAYRTRRDAHILPVPLNVQIDALRAIAASSAPALAFFLDLYQFKFERIAQDEVALWREVRHGLLRLPEAEQLSDAAEDRALLQDMQQQGVLGFLESVQKLIAGEHELAQNHLDSFLIVGIKRWVRRIMAHLLQAEVGVGTVSAWTRFLDAANGFTSARGLTLGSLTDKERNDLLEQLREHSPAIKGLTDALAQGLIEGPFADAADENPLEADAIMRELERATRNAVATLTRREQEVLALRFGLHTGDEATAEEIGAQFAVTRDRIRAILAKGIRKLKEQRAELLGPFMQGQETEWQAANAAILSGLGAPLNAELRAVVNSHLYAVVSGSRSKKMKQRRLRLIRLFAEAEAGRMPALDAVAAEFQVELPSAVRALESIQQILAEAVAFPDLSLAPQETHARVAAFYRSRNLTQRGTAELNRLVSQVGTARRSRFAQLHPADQQRINDILRDQASLAMDDPRLPGLQNVFTAFLMDDTAFFPMRLLTRAYGLPMEIQFEIFDSLNEKGITSELLDADLQNIPGLVFERLDEPGTDIDVELEEGEGVSVLVEKDVTADDVVYTLLQDQRLPASVRSALPLNRTPYLLVPPLPKPQPKTGLAWMELVAKLKREFPVVGRFFELGYFTARIQSLWDDPISRSRDEVEALLQLPANQEDTYYTFDTKDKIGKRITPEEMARFVDTVIADSLQRGAFSSGLSQAEVDELIQAFDRRLVQADHQNRPLSVMERVQLALPLFTPGSAFAEALEYVATDAQLRGLALETTSAELLDNFPPELNGEERRLMLHIIGSQNGMVAKRLLGTAYWYVISDHFKIGVPPQLFYPADIVNKRLEAAVKTATTKPSHDVVMGLFAYDTENYQSAGVDIKPSGEKLFESKPELQGYEVRATLHLNSVGKPAALTLEAPEKVEQVVPDILAHHLFEPMHIRVSPEELRGRLQAIIGADRVIGAAKFLANLSLLPKDLPLRLRGLGPRAAEGFVETQLPRTLAEAAALEQESQAGVVEAQARRFDDLLEEDQAELRRLVYEVARVPLNTSAPDDWQRNQVFDSLARYFDERPLTPQSWSALYQELVSAGIDTSYAVALANALSASAQDGAAIRQVGRLTPEFLAQVASIVLAGGFIEGNGKDIHLMGVLENVELHNQLKGLLISAEKIDLSAEVRREIHQDSRPGYYLLMPSPAEYKTLLDVARRPRDFIRPSSQPAEAQTLQPVGRLTQELLEVLAGLKAMDAHVAIQRSNDGTGSLQVSMLYPFPFFKDQKNRAVHERLLELVKQAQQLKLTQSRAMTSDLVNPEGAGLFTYLIVGLTAEELEVARQAAGVPAEQSEDEILHQQLTILLGRFIGGAYEKQKVVQLVSELDRSTVVTLFQKYVQGSAGITDVFNLFGSLLPKPDRNLGRWDIMVDRTVESLTRLRIERQQGAVNQVNGTQQSLDELLLAIDSRPEVVAVFKDYLTKATSTNQQQLLQRLREQGVPQGRDEYLLRQVDQAALQGLSDRDRDLLISTLAQYVDPDNNRFEVVLGRLARALRISLHTSTSGMLYEAGKEDIGLSAERAFDLMTTLWHALQAGTVQSPNQGIGRMSALFLEEFATFVAMVNAGENIQSSYKLSPEPGSPQMRTLEATAYDDEPEFVEQLRLLERAARQPSGLLLGLLRPRMHRDSQKRMWTLTLNLHEGGEFEALQSIEKEWSDQGGAVRVLTLEQWQKVYAALSIEGNTMAADARRRVDQALEDAESTEASARSLFLGIVPDAADVTVLSFDIADSPDRLFAATSIVKQMVRADVSIDREGKPAEITLTHPMLIEEPSSIARQLFAYQATTAKGDKVYVNYTGKEYNSIRFLLYHEWTIRAARLLSEILGSDVPVRLPANAKWFRRQFGTEQPTLAQVAALKAPSEQTTQRGSISIGSVLEALKQKHPATVRLLEQKRVQNYLQVLLDQTAKPKVDVDEFYRLRFKVAAQMVPGFMAAYGGVKPEDIEALLTTVIALRPEQVGMAYQAATAEFDDWLESLGEVVGVLRALKAEQPGRGFDVVAQKTNSTIAGKLRLTLAEGHELKETLSALEADLPGVVLLVRPSLWKLDQHPWLQMTKESMGDLPLLVYTVSTTDPAVFKALNAMAGQHGAVDSKQGPQALRDALKPLLLQQNPSLAAMVLFSSSWTGAKAVYHTHAVRGIDSPRIIVYVPASMDVTEAVLELATSPDTADYPPGFPREIGEQFYAALYALSEQLGAVDLDALRQLRNELNWQLVNAGFVDHSVEIRPLAYRENPSAPVPASPESAVIVHQTVSSEATGSHPLISVYVRRNEEGRLTMDDEALLRALLIDETPVSVAFTEAKGNPDAFRQAVKAVAKRRGIQAGMAQAKVVGRLSVSLQEALRHLASSMSEDDLKRLEAPVSYPYPYVAVHAGTDPAQGAQLRAFFQEVERAGIDVEDDPDTDSRGMTYIVQDLTNAERSAWRRAVRAGKLAQDGTVIRRKGFAAVRQQLNDQGFEKLMRVGNTQDTVWELYDDRITPEAAVKQILQATLHSRVREYRRPEVERLVDAVVKVRPKQEGFVSSGKEAAAAPLPERLAGLGVTTNDPTRLAQAALYAPADVANYAVTPDAAAQFADGSAPRWVVVHSGMLEATPETSIELARVQQQLGGVLQGSQPGLRLALAVEGATNTEEAEQRGAALIAAVGSASKGLAGLSRSQFDLVAPATDEILGLMSAVAPNSVLGSVVGPESWAMRLQAHGRDGRRLPRAIIYTPDASGIVAVGAAVESAAANGRFKPGVLGKLLEIFGDEAFIPRAAALDGERRRQVEAFRASMEASVGSN